MAAKRWTTEEISDFLDLYHRYEVLWRNNRENDAKETEKEAAFNKLLQDMNNIGRPISAEDLRTKIRIVWTIYRNETKKMKKSIRNGGDPNNVYIPQLPWFSKADSFLNQANQSRSMVTHLAGQRPAVALLATPTMRAAKENGKTQFNSAENNILGRGFFFQIPFDPELRAAWIKEIQRKNWTPSSQSRLCSDHFLPSHLNNTYASERVTLREGAIPSVFSSFPEGLKNNCDKLSPSNRPSTSSCLRKRKSSIQEEESRVDRLLQSQTNNTTTTTTTRPVIQKLNSTPTTLLFATPQAKAESDEYEAVGMNVAAKLRKMSATQQIFAESLIVKILTKGMLEKLTEDTDVITVTNYYEYNRSSNNCYISGSNSTDPEDVSNCEVQFHE